MENKKQKLQTRYGQVSDYNRTRILNEVKKLLKKEGAELLEKDFDKYYYKAYTNNNGEYKKIVDALPKIKKVSYDLGGDVLKFILDGFYYYIEYDDNPLFPIKYQKIGIDKEGKYKGKRYMYETDIYDTVAFSICYNGLYDICDNNKIKRLARYHYKQMKAKVINGNESSSYNNDTCYIEK